jgi:hypothetical protein
MTTSPTTIIIVLRGSRCVSLAAMGAAMTPPTISPAMIPKYLRPIVAKNVSELANETKNSARLTDPIVTIQR